ARIAAGDRRDLSLGASEAARIFTGAPVPEGADTVIMQEDTAEAGGGRVSLHGGARRGANLRRAGEDLEKGAVIVDRGARLRPPDIAALASIGLARVPVFERLRVGILSSGDELQRPGEALGTAGVYDANSYLLRALAGTLPVEPVDLGIVRDRRDSVEERLGAAARACDLVITSGGASRGEEDHFVRALAGRGGLHAWQIAVKPGRPLGLGSWDGTRVLMLPGNPVAVMVCFLLYAMPLIARLGGGRPREPRRFFVPAAFEIVDKKPDRREFLRGMLAGTGRELHAEKYKRDGSGLISSLRAADGLIELGEPVTRVAPGDMVAFLPFSEFGLPAA
ncbi:MAG: molybdopterin molybdotransferase MoeA, partial [Alphaproteobacteria bacterium]|nr:molybdopterin molybdotransferase MoeA [Alphaproteobacteria bacterium]